MARSSQSVPASSRSSSWGWAGGRRSRRTSSTLTTASWRRSRGRWAGLLASVDSAVARPSRIRLGDSAGTALSLGLITTFLTVVVVLPLAALTWESTKDGAGGFWDAVTSPQAVAALKLTIGASLIVSLINAVLGTVTAWVLVRDDFRGKSVVNAIIDLPFALPTIVAGLVLLALYGPHSPVGIDIAYT